MTRFPHLLEARIRDARERGEFDEDGDESQEAKALPIEVVLMQEIEKLKQERAEVDDAETRRELTERIVELSQELTMYHERAGRYITASKV